MYNAAHMAETIHEAEEYGLDFEFLKTIIPPLLFLCIINIYYRFSIEKRHFNWQKLKASRDNYVRTLSGIYKSFLPDIGVS